MDETVTTLMRANLIEIFGQRDAALRDAAARRTYTEDIVFGDPEGEVTGIDAVVGKAQALLDGVPADFVFAEVGPLYAGAGEAALAWTFGPAGGEPAVRGIDIATITDGRISHLRTFLAG
ncbi:hypothetical protein GCM10022223_42810 [Kineosporia mesophila]|uniref:SnoaL-like domain-containing protein n=1 Tax=Kineosporia mesophila TaxID=566012 RepID=A0ABP6ZWS4_9ACTN|nr:nuclear transport factor 2 family protein [Kineosporia mesophila]MCD5353280.1 nuclear transport factor 2 family protein [Kineosporia mesophila]